MLNEVLAELADPTWENAAASAISWRILLPLEWFGLLERRDLPAKNRWEQLYEVRKTPLFDRFIEIRL